MAFRNLPPEALAVLAHYAAPPRLVAHLTVVHDVAVMLCEQLSTRWPHLDYDRVAVTRGAAIHDIGKIAYPDELTGPGSQHEEIGPHLLLQQGWPEAYARFARTHARWHEEPAARLEDMLVAFADTIWKGKRDEQLEQALTWHIAQQIQQEPWDVYMKLDDLAEELARDAHERILWQGQDKP
jgi:hypothetical protein